MIAMAMGKPRDRTSAAEREIDTSAGSPNDIPTSKGLSPKPFSDGEKRGRYEQLLFEWDQQRAGYTSKYIHQLIERNAFFDLFPE